MTDVNRNPRLEGRIFLDFNISVITGLHIGGSPGTLAIGNVDNPVVRNPLTDEPYVPGSSLRGKMRSLQEKHLGKSATQKGRISERVWLHICEEKQDYDKCEVCRTFGVPSSLKFAETSRLIVRDAFLTPECREELRQIRTDLPFTEVKWEAAIDRVTSAAVPRQQERVPAGAVFSGALTFSLYAENDMRLFPHVLKALELVEEDYLGGQGARGSGQVVFRQLDLTVRMNDQYNQAPRIMQSEMLHDLQDQWQQQYGG